MDILNWVSENTFMFILICVVPTLCICGIISAWNDK